MLLQAAIGVGIFLGVFITIILIIARLIVLLIQTIAWLASGRHMSYSLYLKTKHTLSVWLTGAVMLVLMALVMYLLRDYTFL